MSASVAARWIGGVVATAGTWTRNGVVRAHAFGVSIQGSLLPEHHRRAEATCRELLASACGNDHFDVVRPLFALEAELLQRIGAEEEVILPGYAVYAPADAQRIRDQHVRIGALMTPVGIELEAHAVRVARLRALVDALASHFATEGAAMYPWAVRNVALVTQRMLYTRAVRPRARSFDRANKE